MGLIKKDEVELRVKQLLNREVDVQVINKHSPNHIDQYVRAKGTLKNFDVGEDDEDVIVYLENVVIDKNKRSEAIWVNAQDIVQVMEKKK